MNRRPPYLTAVGNTALKVNPLVVLWGWLELRLNYKCTDHLYHPIIDLANVIRAIENHPDTADHFWFDEFHGACFTDWQCASHTLGQDDVLRLTVWLQTVVSLRTASDGLVRNAARAVALRHVRNAPKDWMGSLRWDGTQRLATSLSTYLGADDTECTRAAAKNFWTSMVARIYQPGCEVGKVLMLQNSDSATLSMALNVIGESWYWCPREDLPRRDLYTGLRSTMLVEISNPADLGWRVLTRSVDNYRQPYAHAHCDQRRANIFVVTAEGDWDMPETVWNHLTPVTCGTLDVEKLAHNREQLFAEAVQLYYAREFLI